MPKVTEIQTARCLEETLSTEPQEQSNQPQLDSGVVVGSKKQNKGRKTKKSGKFGDFFLVLVFFLGLAILIYPTFSNYVNSLRQGRAIAHYDETIAGMKKEDFEAQWQVVNIYNQNLLANRSRMHPSKAQLDHYKKILNVTGDSMMGHLEIRKLRVSLPIYHTVEDSVLQAGVGHIPGTSLPSGGLGTHVALSGHRGLPTSKLFTDLDRLVEGDRFVLHVLDRSLTYEVDQIRVVKPQEVNTLSIDPKKDYVTLVTCTPYAINTHRLLVRGHRVPNDNTGYVPADAVPLDPILVSSVVSVPIFVILFGTFVFGHHQHRKQNNKRYAK